MNGVGESLITVSSRDKERRDVEKREYTLLFCFVVKEKGGEIDSKDGF